MTSFSVVVMTNETPDVMRRFLKYYKDSGSECIFVYYDIEKEDCNQEESGVEFTFLNEDFWRSAKCERPTLVEERQVFVYADAYARCESDWLLIVDADEYVFGELPIRQFLDWVPRDAPAIRLETAEAVYGPGDDPTRAFGARHFRLAHRSRIWRILGPLVYGRDADLFEYGVAGHHQGKQFVRTGISDARPNLHGTHVDGVQIARRLTSFPSPRPQMYLGHFDALSLDRWSEKCLARITGRTRLLSRQRNRQAQLEVVRAAAARGDAALRRTFECIYGLRGWRYRILKAFGLAFRRDIFNDAS